MKKAIWIAVVLSALAGTVWSAAAYWLLRRSEPQWTSRSPKALKEYELGLENLAKLYRMDAVRHFEEALQLDPSFAMAKLHLALLASSSSERGRLLSELNSIERSRLTDRERFLLSYHAARADGRNDEAEEMLRTFRKKHPDDPYGFRAECREEWQAQRWDLAGSCYADLLAVHPNLVEAHNNLGYIAMARGRFDEAEEHFRTYRYVAPDQANPHHSLAELLTIRGRYEEALESLAQAVRIKPDFCEVYTTRVEIGLAARRIELARDALRDLAGIEACAWLEKRGAVCVARAWMLYLVGDAEGAWRLLDGGCLERREGFDLLAHRVAVMTGRLERGLEMEAELKRYHDEVRGAGRPVHAEYLAAYLAHMEGIRALAENQVERAVGYLREADGAFGYWGGERASIKLFNRLNLLRALDLLGRADQAAALRREIDAVNPRLVNEFPLPDVGEFKRKGRNR